MVLIKGDASEDVAAGVGGKNASGDVGGKNALAGASGLYVEQQSFPGM